MLTIGEIDLTSIRLSLPPVSSSTEQHVIEISSSSTQASVINKHMSTTMNTNPSDDQGRYEMIVAMKSSQDQRSFEAILHAQSSFVHMFVIHLIFAFVPFIKII